MALDAFDRRNRKFLSADKHEKREKKQGSQAGWCIKEDVSRKTLDTALSAFDGRDKKVPLSADESDIGLETIGMPGTAVECQNNWVKTLDGTGCIL